MLLYFWDFNYSKMVNEGPQTYSNTFWMISETSKKSTKSGPWHLFSFVEMLQKHKKIMETILKIWFLHISIFWNPKIKNVRPYRTPNMWNLAFSFWFCFLFCFFQCLFGGLKTIGFSERFQRFFGGGIWINFGNLKIIKMLKHK